MHGEPYAHAGLRTGRRGQHCKRGKRKERRNKDHGIRRSRAAGADNFQADGTAEKEKMTIYSIVDSLTELDNIQRVQFLMDGKKVDNFGNINIGSMFGRDGSIIAE